MYLEETPKHVEFMKLTKTPKEILAIEEARFNFKLTNSLP
jgi:hypothetical protein